jgi:mono/diheme cytochrome c family protein
VHRAWLLSFALCLTSACDRQAPDLREWRASDHDHTQNPGSDQVEGGPDAGSELAEHGLNEVVLVAWDQNCVRCHGRFGRGDGPQGPMVRATDLTNPRWQATATDDGIVKVIREGRGLMPAFPLPETTLLSFVKLIRLLGKATAAMSSASAAGSASAAPGVSAAGSASAAPGVSASLARSAAPATVRSAAPSARPTAASPVPTSPPPAPSALR